jgi:two-component system OmpR family response regulator
VTALTLKGLVVLLVEDDTDTRQVLTCLLELEGAEVMAAASAVEALDHLRVRTPDVIVSDLCMPGVDGYELLRAVRVLGGPEAAVPAVAMTAFPAPHGRLRAMEAGFQEYLVKPDDVVRLGPLLAELAAQRVG